MKYSRRPSRIDRNASNPVIDTHYIPAHVPFAEQLARQVNTDHSDSLPDLSHVHIFIPNAMAAAQLRKQLIRISPGALIGPHIGSLQQWIRQQVPLADAGATPINQQARRLILIEALNRHPQLFGDISPWQLCDSLLELFDELTLQHRELLDCSQEHWLDTLRQAYGMNGGSPLLSHEARIVHTLWQAWHEQMQALHILDACEGYRQRLQRVSEEIRNHCFYIVGAPHLSALEQACCEALAETNRVRYIEQETRESSGLFDIIYDHERPLRERIDGVAAYEDEIDSRWPLSMFDAKNAEQQAAAIDIQTRLWLLNGKTDIAIVSEDRKLARRVRALLERSGIVIQDTAGWSLSTTSAASCIERWLECIEGDFAYQPLLDLLKSPFFIDDAEREPHLNTVYRLEQDIIYHENIPGDIRRYRLALKQRQRRLSHWSSGTYDRINSLLDLLQQQAEPLSILYRSNRPQPAQHYLLALRNSLQQLGMESRLEDDLAGQCILGLLDNMQHSLRVSSPIMNWNDFRTWLASSLEQEQFTPQNAGAGVQLMNMKQAQYCRFDALIIAGANRDSLPGSSAQAPFFNQQVKKSLGLKNWSDEKAAGFLMFRNFLEAAENVLITYTSEQAGEWMPPSPWVTSLSDFYRLAFDRDLQDRQLARYLRRQESADGMEAANLEKHPGTPLDSTLIPAEFSASRYQRLMDCPYKFFAADGLALKAEESISEELLKSEYGEKVHLILYAFHTQVRDLPAPFTDTVTSSNRIAALHHLESLSRAVFADNIEDNVQHRGWLQRWLYTAEAYIDWLIEHNANWSVYQLEQSLDTALEDGIRIRGRLDRIDRSAEGYGIIDYKTGRTQSQKDVNSGEDVQLVSYAKLLDGVCEVAYLKLDNGEAKVAARLADEQLNEIRDASRQRLQTIVRDIREGHKLSAWGDRDTCRYCDMKGLCRKQVWENL